MWVISQSGFVSLVQDRKDHSKVWIRARIKEDIAQMFPEYAAEIVTMPGADYLFRLIVPKEVASMAMWNAVADVDYDSHAKEVMNRRSHPVKGRMQAYYKIWHALADLQPFAPYSRTPRPVNGQAARTFPTRPIGSVGPMAGSGGSEHTGWVSNQHYNWDNHPQSTTFRGGKPYAPEGTDQDDWDATGKAVDLISGEDLDDIDDVVTELSDVEINRMTDAEWNDYLQKRESERTGPAGKSAIDELVVEADIIEQDMVEADVVTAREPEPVQEELPVDIPAAPLRNTRSARRKK